MGSTTDKEGVAEGARDAKTTGVASAATSTVTDPKGASAPVEVSASASFPSSSPSGRRFKKSKSTLYDCGCAVADAARV